MTATDEPRTNHKENMVQDCSEERQSLNWLLAAAGPHWRDTDWMVQAATVDRHSTQWWLAAVTGNRTAQNVLKELIQEIQVTIVIPGTKRCLVLLNKRLFSINLVEWFLML